MERQRCHGTLITDIEYDLVVGWQTVVQPLDFGSGSFHGMCHHQIFPIWIQCQIVSVEIAARRICHSQGPLVGTIDITEIGTVGIGCCCLQQSRCLLIAPVPVSSVLVSSVHRDLIPDASLYGRWDITTYQHQGKYQYHLHFPNTARQSESELTTLSRLTLCLNITRREERADFLVFINDSLTVEQTESMSAGIGAVEDMFQCFFIHTFSRIFYRYFHKCLMALGTNHDLTSCRCKLPGVVGDGVNHE